MARRHAQPEEDAEINMTPMLDIVFIMLIFFIVTTSFVKEAGFEVTRPPASTAEEKKLGNVMIAITDTGAVWMSKREVELTQVRLLVEQAKSENPEGSVVIIADENAPTGVVVQVMDEARKAGADRVALAAQEGSS
ncbi:MAG: biopolymer transporter ExbD [Gammaproteobacteria bacterium]|nr:biopolymer transporter ExbD [Gammaproteobacteria bacterium]